MKWSALACCAAAVSMGGAIAEKPPYPIFKGDKTSFEPSAVAYDVQTDRVFALNDKDELAYRYQFVDGRLLLPTGERHESIRTREKIRKFESLAPLPNAPGEYLAASSFDRADAAHNRVIRFRFAKEGPIDAELIEADDAGWRTAVAKRTGKPWLKIEGMALDRTGKKVFIGIRNIGVDHKDAQDVVIVLRCPFDGKRIGAPEGVFRFATEPAIGRLEGLSDLQRDPVDGSYLILTSLEVGQKRIADHGGHLFRVAADALEGTETAAKVPLAAPLRAFRAKSEGLTRLPNGQWLVVFDDDNGGWKSLFENFAVADALFEVFSLPPVEAAPRR